MGRGLGQVT